MTRPYRMNNTLPGLLAASIAITSAPSFSAPVASDDVEEIIVTASKREQRLQDFSGSISVITDPEVMATLSDVANRIPGLSVLDAGPRNPASIVIRGLRMDEVGSNDFGGDGASVASYVDNIPLQGYFVPPSFSLKDLQQVEVLRGPQGTLYGNASIGGLIRYITAKPDVDTTSVKLDVGLSQTKESDGINYDTDLVINAPLSDTLAARLLLGQTKNQGFIDNPYLLSGPAKDINDDETDVARLGLRWQASDNLSVTGSYHYQKTNVEDRQAANDDFTGDEYTASSRYRQPMEGELQLIGLDADYRFESSTLTASINRYDYETTTIADQTDYLLKVDEIYFGNTYYSTYEDFSAWGTGAVDVEKDSAEVRLVSSQEQPWRWLAGGFFSRDDLDVLLIDVTPGFGEFAGEDRPQDMDYLATQTETLRENSFYGELAYDLTQSLEVSAGARYFRYDDQLETCWVFFPLPDGQTEYPLASDCMPGDDIHKGTLGKFGAQYHFNEQQQVYFTVSEGFRRGGANSLPADIDVSRFYKPDTATNYEWGTKSSWFGQALELNASVFYVDWNDIQVASILDGAYSITANAKGARSQGVEIETNHVLNDHWTVNLGYSFVDAELTESVAGINGGTENAYEGDKLPGAPRHQWNLGVEYSQSINTAVVDVAINVARNSEIYTALNEEFTNYSRLNGFSTANASVGVSLRNWRTGAFVNNIANTRGITGKRTSEWHGEQGKFEYITRPRTFGVFVSYQY